MASGGYGDFGPYVPVAKRLANGRRELERLAKQRGRPLAPVTLERKQIAESFWGKAWCQQLERHSDFASRLPRGRTYVRNGSVLPGLVERAAPAADHRNWRGRQAQLESRRKYYGVGLVQSTVLRSNSRAFDRLDRVGDQLDVLTFERRPIVV